MGKEPCTRLRHTGMPPVHRWYSSWTHKNIRDVIANRYGSVSNIQRLWPLGKPPSEASTTKLEKPPQCLVHKRGNTILMHKLPFLIRVQNKCWWNRERRGNTLAAATVWESEHCKWACLCTPKKWRMVEAAIPSLDFPWEHFFSIDFFPLTRNRRNLGLSLLVFLVSFIFVLRLSNVKHVWLAPTRSRKWSILCTKAISECDNHPVKMRLSTVYLQHYWVKPGCSCHVCLPKKHSTSILGIMVIKYNARASADAVPPETCYSKIMAIKT